MTFRNAAAVAAAIGMFAVFAMGEVSAEPKGGGTKGCTAEQLQTPGAQACLRKMEQDVLAGKSASHFVSCDLATGEIDCCAPTGDHSYDCSPAQAIGGGHFMPKAPVAGNVGAMASPNPTPPKMPGFTPPGPVKPMMQTTEPMSRNVGKGKIQTVGVKVTTGGSGIPKTVVSCGGDMAGKTCTVPTHTCANMATDMFNCCGQREVVSASCDKKTN